MQVGKGYAPLLRATTTHALPRKVSRRSKRSEIDSMQASTNTHARIVGDHLDAASVLEDFFLSHSATHPCPCVLGILLWLHLVVTGLLPNMAVPSWLFVSSISPRQSRSYLCHYNVVAHPSLSSLVSTALLLALST